MAKKAQPKNSQLARAYLLSYPQLFVFAIIFAAIGGLTVWKSFAAPHVSSGGGGSCSVTPAQVALDQVWTVNATGLPTNSVNQILTFPDGASSSGPITVQPDGTFTTTGNSNMSATWGFIAPEQKGTYTYQYVNRIKWPAGSYTKIYAKCAVVVS